MTDPFEINENSEKRYYLGKVNFVIRIYYYLNEGLNQINNWKYIIAGVLGFAYLVGITDYWKITLMILGATPVSILIGYLWVIRGRKSTEYYSMKYTSPFGRYQIQMQERQMELLEEINKGIEKLNTRSSFNNFRSGGFMNDKNITGGSFIPFCEICKGVGCSTCTP